MTNQHPSPDGPGDQWAELERLAKAATRGPWQRSGVRRKLGGEDCIGVGPDAFLIAFLPTGQRPHEHAGAFRDAGYIAAAHPQAILSLIAAARAAPPGDQWRPIETAPKDGTAVDLFLPDNGKTMLDQRLTSARWRTNRLGLTAWHSRDGFNMDDTATHWQPLPAPPGEANSKGSLQPQEAASVPTGDAVPDPACHLTGWKARMIDGNWRVGMNGNLDTVHDARVTVHSHEETDDEARRIAEFIAAAYNAARSSNSIDASHLGMSEANAPIRHVDDYNDPVLLGLAREEAAFRSTHSVNTELLAVVEAFIAASDAAMLVEKDHPHAAYADVLRAAYEAKALSRAQPNTTEGG